MYCFVPTYAQMSIAKTQEIITSCFAFRPAILQFRAVVQFVFLHSFEKRFIVARYKCHCQSGNP